MVVLLEKETTEKKKKKNKVKYLPILDYPPLKNSATDTSPTIMRKL